MKKLASILLVDDSEADNFIHVRRIRKMNVAEHIAVCEHGQEALEYLTTPQADGSYPRPDLLFLDINMPVLDGWGFLDTYQHLPEHQQARTLITFLPQPANPSDHIRASAYGVIHGHESKPLHRDSIRAVLQEFFPHHFTDGYPSSGDQPPQQ